MSDKKGWLITIGMYAGMFLIIMLAAGAGFGEGEAVMMWGGGLFLVILISVWISNIESKSRKSLVIGLALILAAVILLLAFQDEGILMLVAGILFLFGIGFIIVLIKDSINSLGSGGGDDDGYGGVIDD